MNQTSLQSQEPLEKQNAGTDEAQDHAQQEHRVRGDRRRYGAGPVQGGGENGGDLLHQGAHGQIRRCIDRFRLGLAAGGASVMDLSFRAAGLRPGVAGAESRDNEGRGVLDVYQIVFIRAVVDGDIIAAVILVVVQVILSVVVFLKSSVIVVIGGGIVVPGFEVRAVGVLVVGSVIIQKILEADVSLVIVRVVGGVMDGVEGFIVAVNDL